MIDGPIDRTAFDLYIETQLAPTLRKGDIVILDNLSVHDSHDARQTLHDRGAWFLPLPQYSPDLNPIEMAFAKLKAHLRKAPRARSTPYGALSATSAPSSNPTNAGISSSTQTTRQIKRTML